MMFCLSQNQTESKNVSEQRRAGPQCQGSVGRVGQAWLTFTQLNADRIASSNSDAPFPVYPTHLCRWVGVYSADFGSTNSRCRFWPLDAVAILAPSWITNSALPQSTLAGFGGGGGRKRVLAQIKLGKHEKYMYLLGFCVEKESVCWSGSPPLHMGRLGNFLIWRASFPNNWRGKRSPLGDADAVKRHTVNLTLPTH